MVINMVIVIVINMYDITMIYIYIFLDKLQYFPHLGDKHGNLNNQKWE
jgi:hypothetical protein